MHLFILDIHIYIYVVKFETILFVVKFETIAEGSKIPVTENY